ncbi:MAG: hypothetical protein ACKOZU_01820 [Planctomycetaceae bacterium]
MCRLQATAIHRRGAVLAAAVACAAGAARGDDAVTWRDVVAEAPIDHAVTIRGPFDDAHGKVQLVGPVGVAASDAGPCFTAYAVAARGDEPARMVPVGAAAVPVRLGPPAFLLVPARRLRDGGPATDAPAGVYEARPILDPPEAVAGVPATAGRPTHLCLPVDYRHHFEQVPVGDAGRGLLLCAARDADRADAPIDVADDFGLHRLAAAAACRDAAWVPVGPPAPH